MLLNVLNFVSFSSYYGRTSKMKTYLAAQKSENQLLKLGRLILLFSSTNLRYVLYDPFKPCIANPSQNSLGKISFTADIWSNQSRYPYLAITGHWLSRTQGYSLQLNAAVLAFHRLRGSHNGERLARIVVHLLDRVGITVKVSFYFVTLPCKLTIY